MNDKGPVLSKVLRYWRDKDVCRRALWCSLAAAILVWGLIELFVLGTRDIRESCLLTTGVFDAEFSYRHRRELVFQSLPCAQGINLIPLWARVLNVVLPAIVIGLSTRVLVLNRKKP